MKKILNEIKRRYEIYCIKSRKGKYKRMRCCNCKRFFIRADTTYAKPTGYCTLFVDMGETEEPYVVGFDDRCECFSDKRE